MSADGIIPAYAGSTEERCGARAVRRDHPRIRGEHEANSLDGQTMAGSSPHTRGAPKSMSFREVGTRIIPAYAGSTTGCPSTSCRWKGSSPHTRGAHLEIPAIPRIAAVIIPVFLYPSPTPQEEADRSMVLLTLS